MHRFAPKTSICAVLALLSCASLAQNTGIAVVAGSGSVYLNGAQLSNSNAVVAGDVIQTKENGTATINGPGGSVLIESNSIVRFKGQSVSLDRGQISVATGQSLSVNARDLRIVPVSNRWTQYYVTRTGGSINIAARRDDVTVNCGTTRGEKVDEGKQLSREDADNCGLAKNAVAHPAATGPILAGSAAKWAAVGAGGALTIWSLHFGDDPISPDKP